jgi:hypothetical protein
VNTIEIQPPLSIPKDPILKKLGGRRRSRISARTKSELDRALDMIHLHAKPRAIFKILPLKRVNGVIQLNDGTCLKSRNLSRILKPCWKVALFLATIGDGVDQIIHRVMKKEPHFGFILDAAASVAVESFVGSLADTIDAEIDGDEGTTLRYSPGYCDWPLKEQLKLFKLLPAEKLDVSLSPELFMQPRKSVSGVIGIGKKNALISNGNACLNCTNVTCQYRRK